MRRLREDDGTWMGHILEHVAIELQALTGAGVTFGKTRGTGQSGQYHVVYSYEEERAGLAAADLAMEMIHHAIPEALRGDAKVRDDFNFEEELDELITYAQRRQFGPFNGLADPRSGGTRHPLAPPQRLLAGSVRSREVPKRIQATITSETRHIAVEIASDKEETNDLLTAIGALVPRQKLVQSARRARAPSRSAIRSW